MARWTFGFRDKAEMRASFPFMFQNLGSSSSTTQQITHTHTHTDALQIVLFGVITLLINNIQWENNSMRILLILSIKWHARRLECPT